MRIPYHLLVLKTLLAIGAVGSRRKPRNGTQQNRDSRCRRLVRSASSLGPEVRPKKRPPRGLRLGPALPRVAKRKAFMIGVNEVVSGAKSAKSAMTAAAEKANAVIRG